MDMCGHKWGRLGLLLAMLSATPAYACPSAAIDGPGQPRLSAPMPGEIASGFGPRLHPVLQVMKMHVGIDYDTALGTPVKAALGGEVTQAGYDGAYGNRVTVRHGAGYEPTYSHLSKIDVAVGDVLDTGVILGKAGSTGLVAGVRLHFELKRNGQFIDPLAALAPAKL